jgi:hypothetical protein
MKIQQEQTSLAEQEQRCLSKQYQKSCMKNGKFTMFELSHVVLFKKHENFFSVVSLNFNLKFR